mmetsp:Transcript_17665/g.25949  ORF Transcript_17665/g.25949 Transcript_17665/m.25949 type:complete len:148 (-) Transcript_17665:2604-3047(-)
MFTPYVTVSGLTARDLPPKSCPSGILPVPIPGLCMERSKDPSCEKVGYLMLLRSDVSLESVHLRNHTHYHKNVYKPCMNEVRKHTHQFDIDTEKEVPINLTSVGWNDGDVHQLKSESIYDFLGFPKDEANGNVYERQHGIEDVFCRL